MKKILVDGRFVGVGESISRYTLEILSRILESDKENEYTLLIRPEGIKTFEEFFQIRNFIPAKAGIQMLDLRVKPEDDGRGVAQNLHLEVLDIPHYSKSEQIQLLKYLNREKFDLVHFTQFNYPILYRGKFVVTIHDLTMQGHLHRQKFYRSIAFNLVMKSAVKNSKKVLTVSQFSKNDILDHYKVPPGKIVVTYNGIDHSRFKAEIRNSKHEIQNFKDGHNITGDYLLYTGAWKKHKNILRTLKAFEKYSLQCHSRPDRESSLDPRVQACLPAGRPEDDGRGIQLVLVGKIDDKEPEVIREINRINFEIAKLSNGYIAGEQDRIEKDSNNLTIKQFNNMSIIATGFIPEEQLPIAYAGALAYIIPSLSEGFGLPPLEAMACGTPVIASKESCMPEILGDAAYYFDPYDIEDMTKAMGRIAQDGKLRENLIEKGIRQARKYDWSKTAEETLEVYRNVLKEG